MEGQGYQKGEGRSAKWEKGEASERAKEATNRRRENAVVKCSLQDYFLLRSRPIGQTFTLFKLLSRKEGTLVLRQTGLRVLPEKSRQVEPYAQLRVEQVRFVPKTVPRHLKRMPH